MCPLFRQTPDWEATLSNPKSAANVAGHPLHPMLVGFPIAFFVTTFVSDLAFGQTGNAFWATASFWLLGAGLVTAALAALAGLVDFLVTCQDFRYQGHFQVAVALR